MARVLLVARDHPDQSDYAARSLRRTHHVVVAADPHEAAEKLLTDEFDVVVSLRPAMSPECADAITKLVTSGRKCPGVIVGDAKDVQWSVQIARRELAGPEGGALEPVDIEERIATIMRSSESLKGNDHLFQMIYAVFVSSAIGMLIVDSAGVVTEINTRAESVLGVTRKKGIGMELDKLLKLLPNKLSDQIRSAISVHCDHFPFDLFRNDGTTGESLQVRSRTIKGPGGKIAGNLLVFLESAHLQGVASTGQVMCAAGFVGESTVLRQMKSAVEKAAADRSPVTIIAETGSMARQLALSIHKLAFTPEAPFVTVDCAIAHWNVLEGQLLGVQAENSESPGQEGKIALANGGTLLFEEVSLLPQEGQRLLLNLLKTGKLGGDGRAPRLNVRVIVSNRRPLVEVVARGLFDEDLYHLLREIKIFIPHLRERREDIHAVVEAARVELNARLGLQICSIDDQARDALQRHSWPGNVAELFQVLENAFMNCRGPVLRVQHLGADFATQDKHSEINRQARYDAQRQELVDVLSWAGWNKSKAARRLGVSRETLYRRLQKFSLTDEQ